MLIVNDDHLRLAGIESWEEQCVYCSKRLAAYPLILSDDVDQTVYHVTCALELATDLMVDIFTFFSPPTPYPPLFALTAPEVASVTMLPSSRAQVEGVNHAVNEHSPDQSGHPGSSLYGNGACDLSNGTSSCR